MQPHWITIFLVAEMLRDTFQKLDHGIFCFCSITRHRFVEPPHRLHRTYVVVPRSLDHVRFGSVSCRAMRARQN